MKNKSRETLYGNLVRGVYALDGIDGEFVANLCRRLPFKPRAAEWPERATLTRLPSNVVAALQEEIDRVEGEMADLADGALDDPWWVEGDAELVVTEEWAESPTGRVEIFWGMQDELAAWQAKLAAA